MRSTSVGDEVARIGIRLVDDAYASWSVAEAECQNALCACREAALLRLAEAA